MKGLNEVTQQGSYSSQHGVYSTPCYQSVYNESLQILNALLQSQSGFSNILVQLSAHIIVLIR